MVTLSHQDYHEALSAYANSGHRPYFIRPIYERWGRLHDENEMFLSRNLFDDGRGS